MVGIKFYPPFFTQLQGVPEPERILRHRNGPIEHGCVAAVPNLGQTAVKVPKVVHGVRGADRSQPESSGVSVSFEAEKQKKILRTGGSQSESTPLRLNDS